jgi:hypothetical protein
MQNWQSCEKKIEIFFIFFFKRSFRQQDFKLETSALNFRKIQTFCMGVKNLYVGETRKSP